VQLATLAGDAPKVARRDAARHARTCEPCRGRALQDRFVEATFAVDKKDALLGVEAAERALERVFDDRRVSCGRVEAPFGPVFLARSRAGLCRVAIRYRKEHDFLRELEARELLPEFKPDKVEKETRALEDYFRGRRKTFQIPVDLRFVTPFQRQVLRAASRIPFGAVKSYGQVARQIGKPDARRAVGGALGKNPIAIVIPCHRVIAANGAIGGYTGGLHIKRELMRIEGITLQEELS